MKNKPLQSRTIGVVGGAFSAISSATLQGVVFPEVNSEGRADAIRKKIETVLGKGVRYRASEIQAPDRMLADLRTAGGIGDGAASGEDDRLAEMPEVRAKISEMMAAHWEHWVDQPLPILGNRTPMEA